MSILTKDGIIPLSQYKEPLLRGANGTSSGMAPEYDMLRDMLRGRRGRGFSTTRWMDDDDGRAWWMNGNNGAVWLGNGDRWRNNGSANRWRNSDGSRWWMNNNGTATTTAACQDAAIARCPVVVTTLIKSTCACSDF